MWSISLSLALCPASASAHVLNIPPLLHCSDGGN
jgi:hypothetical protein